MTLPRTAAIGFGLAWLAACSPSGSDPKPPPSPAPPTTAAPAPLQPAPAAPAASAGGGGDAAGAKLYATYCASCHGPRGDGDGPLAANLDPKPAKHSDPAYMSTLTDEDMFRVIKEGGAAAGLSPLMAPWGGTLTDAQIRDVVAFTRSLSR
jgi:mono/diheme cytochrome c family protein